MQEVTIETLSPLRIIFGKRNEGELIQKVNIIIAFFSSSSLREYCHVQLHPLHSKKKKKWKQLHIFLRKLKRKIHTWKSRTSRF